MYAVVVNLTITDPRAAERALREQLVPRVSQAPRFVSGYWTTKDDSALSMFMFETEEAAERMGEHDAPRSRTTEEDRPAERAVAVRGARDGSRM